jgi:pheophorbide a oxygenase
MAWRRWLADKAGSGPEYAPGATAADEAQPYRDSLGKLRRRELLDRFSQHTQHCAACSQARPKSMHPRSACGMCAAVELLSERMEAVQKGMKRCRGG